MNELRILTVKEAARRKGCTLTYVYALLAAGRLPGARKAGRVWRIPAASILKSSKGGTGAPAARVSA
jgi:excisionase family DNA binding protein